MPGLVSYHWDGRIGYIGLNRFEKLNAIAPPVIVDYDAAIDEFATDLGTRVGVLYGEARACCVGMDLSPAGRTQVGAIGAFSGVFAAPKLYLQPTMMDNVLRYAFVGAVLVGMTSCHGAIVDSLAVGIVVALVTMYVPVPGDGLGLVVAGVLIWAVQLVSPNSLFGRAEEHAPW